MKPWQIQLLAAVILNGLVLLALVFTGQLAKLNSVLAGAVLPTIISCGLLLYAEQSKNKDPQNLQKINIIGFFFKVILLGVWAAILVKAQTLDNVTFIVILLINFLAWHGVEAYYWPLFGASTAENAHNTGENS